MNYGDGVEKVFQCGSMFEIFSVDKLTGQARTLIERLAEETKDLPSHDFTDFIRSTDNEGTLLSWAQSFCSIDINHDKIIEDEEYRHYVHQNYRSATLSKKDEDRVLAAAMEHFKSAARENDGDSDENSGGITFRLFVKMMHRLRSERHISRAEVDFKLYEFLNSTRTKVTACREDSSAEQNAKITEKASGLLLRLNLHNIEVSNVTCLSSQSGVMISTSISNFYLTSAPKPFPISVFSTAILTHSSL
jgi:hypothetical protein